MVWSIHLPGLLWDIFALFGGLPTAYFLYLVGAGTAEIEMYLPKISMHIDCACIKTKTICPLMLLEMHWSPEFPGLRATRVREACALVQLNGFLSSRKIEYFGYGMRRILIDSEFPPRIN